MKIILLFIPILFLVFSCFSPEKKEINSEKKTLKISQDSLLKNAHLYHTFILELEKKLWAMESFVKIDDGKGWTLIDKNGKYTIKSALNFTKYRSDTLLDYELKVSHMENGATYNGKNFDLDVDYELSENRKNKWILPFSYSKLDKFLTNSYGEATYWFEYDNISTVKTLINEFHIDIHKNGIAKRFDFDQNRSEWIESIIASF